MAKKALKNTNMDTKITQSKAEMKGVIRGAMIKKRNEEVKGHHLSSTNIQKQVGNGRKNFGSRT